MAFSLGNFNIDEIVFGTAQNFEGELLYTLDQLTSAQIEVSSESTDITDKYGNVVRTIYKSKSATFTATNAFLNPHIMNAASGIEIEEAGAGSDALVMPKIQLVKAGSQIVLDGIGALDDTLSVIGIYSSGGNSKALTRAANASLANMTYGYNSASDTITLPPATEGTGSDMITGPVNYLIKYDRTITSGYKLTNTATSFPSTVELTLYCSYVDPCDDTLRACYVVCPSFQASPETTISLNADEQEMDFSGTVQMDYCGAEKVLYYIYFPDEDIVKTAISE